ncbi:MAG: transketolase family protein [Armatimonadetes bacterium]|nr:transketolase family protein [Armatimonadota bacterium]
MADAVKEKQMATRDAYGKALVELGRQDERVVVLDADLAKSTRTEWFAAEFPDRFFDMGIAEQNMIGTAAGLALCGKIPFASSFAVFATGRAWEQVRLTVAYARTNVKICATHGGLSVGEDGPTHQALEDIALMRVLPNMTVIVPADGVETWQATFAIAEYDGPCYMRLGRPKIPVIFSESYRFQIGRAATLRDGADVAIIACGTMVHAALQAADVLAADGLSARVVNMSTIKPLDVETVIACAEQCGAIVTAEEHNVYGGLGSAVAEAVAKHHPVPLELIGLQDTFGRSGTPEELFELYGLTPRHIADACRRAVARKG